MSEATITIKESLLEALLYAVDTKDRTAIANVAADIRRVCEDEKPEKFQTHRVRNEK